MTEGSGWGSRAEWATCIVAALAAAVALGEYHRNNSHELREIAQKAYDRADSNYTEFLKMCAEHPDLDCYSGAELPAQDLTGVDPRAAALREDQQRILYTILIDAFEVAYVNYHNENYAESAPVEYCAQWDGWLREYQKFLRRPVFHTTWQQVGDEFDSRFAECMKEIAERQRVDPKVAPIFVEIPNSCKLASAKCTSSAVAKSTVSAMDKK